MPRHAGATPKPYFISHRVVGGALLYARSADTGRTISSASEMSSICSEMQHSEVSIWMLRTHTFNHNLMCPVKLALMG